MLNCCLLHIIDSTLLVKRQIYRCHSVLRLCPRSPRECSISLLSHDVASVSDITPYIKIDEPLVNSQILVTLCNFIQNNASYKDKI